LSSIEDMVSAALARNGHSELKETWLNLCKMYNEGGPAVLETVYSEKIKEIRSKFTKEMKQIQAVKPVIKARRKKQTRKRK